MSIYTDKYQIEFTKDLNNIFDKLKNKIDKNVLNIIKTEHNKSASCHERQFVYPLVEYVIKDNKVIVDETTKLLFMQNKDERLSHNIKILEKTICWAQKHDLCVPNVSMYIWISDRFPWYIENINFPIFVYARPTNINLPLFPETTFYCMWIDGKYSNNCLDFDKIKNIMNDKCEKSTNKINKIYFKGADTTKTTVGNLRKKIYDYSKLQNKIPLEIHLDANKNFEPLYNYCKYKYLINLPGHYPWSNRLKYLYLTNSYVINVNVRLYNIYPKYEDPEYITLIDYYMDKNNYINVYYNYYKTNHNAPKEYKEKAEKLNNDEFPKFITNLKTIYDRIEKCPDRYEIKKQESYKKIQTLNMKRVYHYIYCALILLSNI